VQYVVRFDRPATSTGPDAVLLSAHHFRESYHEGQLVAYLFLDEEERLVALVRSAHVVYIAVAGTASEPGRPLPREASEAPQGAIDACQAPMEQ
jgi:hypothetical protein